jgi:hypothetical protein
MVQQQFDEISQKEQIQKYNKLESELIRYKKENENLQSEMIKMKEENEKMKLEFREISFKLKK